MKTLLPFCLILLMSPALPAGTAGGDFTLTDHNGATWSTTDARGKVLVLTFGYTHCPDICPTALATVVAAIGELGADSARVQPVFISLDPDRDTQQKLASYVPWFHPAMIGLTGTPEQLADVAGRYRARYQFVGKGKTEHYSLDHSANLYVVDPRGELVAVIPHGLPPKVLVKAIRSALASGDEER